MSSVPTQLQRYALVGVRSSLFDLTAKAQQIRHQFPRLTHLSTVVAGLAATIEQVSELTGDESVENAPRRGRPRAVPAPDAPEPPTPRRRRRRRSRTPPPRAQPAARKSSRARITGAIAKQMDRAWEVGRDTLAVLRDAIEGLTIAEVADQLSTTTKSISEQAARWRLNALVLRRQAALIRKSPPLYKITDLGKQALKEDRDIRI